MSNPIKYSTTSQSLALKTGNYYIGTGDVGKGPTSSTDYYNGITPPSGGYTIYLNKASGGPSIFTPTNDSELIESAYAVLVGFEDSMAEYGPQASKHMRQLDQNPDFNSTVRPFFEKLKQYDIEHRNIMKRNKWFSFKI